MRLLTGIPSNTERDIKNTISSQNLEARDYLSRFASVAPRIHVSGVLALLTYGSEAWRRTPVAMLFISPNTLAFSSAVPVVQISSFYKILRAACLLLVGMVPRFIENMAIFNPDRIRDTIINLIEMTDMT